MRLLIIGFSLVVLLGACGEEEPASDAVEVLVEALGESDYATAYDMLHPDHQQVVDEQLFIDCGRQAEAGSPARVDSYVITGEVKRSRNVPELGDTEVTEVGVNLTQGDEVAYRTWDVVRADGEWRWLMAADALNAFREGRCPGQVASALPAS